MKKITIELVDRRDLSFIGKSIGHGCYDIHAKDFLYWKDRDGVEYSVKKEFIEIIIEEPIFSVNSSTGGE